MGKIRHLFPGGNTPHGFFSYYSNIIPVNANRIFVLKGGPGTGKSTFMKRMGEAIAERGYDVEYHHCSSDNNSLDGLVIPALQVAFIDGTSPHIVDPKNPGCVDEIIHLGDFWDEKSLVVNKDKIITTNNEISNNFQRAYRLLRAAKQLYDDWEAINSRAMNYATANKKAEALLEQIFTGDYTIGAGRIRRLFASAITPDGPVNYLESSVWPMKNCHIIIGDPGTGKSTVVQKIINAAIVRGLDVEAFYCPLDPEKPEHVVIPALDVAVTTSVLPHSCSLLQPASVVDMNQCLDNEYLARYEAQIGYDREMFWELFTQTIQCIRASKQLHDELETCYIPHMDFAGIQKLWEKTLGRVLEYCAE